MADFGKYLKELRESKGMGVNQLAAYSGVSSSTISKIENSVRGVPKPDTIKRLSKPLGVKYEELMQKAGYIIEDPRLKEATGEFLGLIDLSEEDAIYKIKETFSFKGNEINEEQAKMIYYLSLGVVRKDN